MSLQRTTAIVLRSIRQGETSKILTLYTLASGKLSVMAKGARSVKSRFGGSLETMNHISVVYYEKESRDLQMLSQADIIESFLDIHKRLDKTSLALAACEMVNRIDTAGESNPPLFKLLVQTLRTMNHTSNRPADVLHMFEVKLFGVLGFQPDFGQCLSCGRAADGAVAFNFDQGGFVCSSCKDGIGAGVFISKESIDRLRRYQTMTFDQVVDVTTSEAVVRQIDEFIQAYFNYHLGGFRELKALRVYKRL